VEAINGLLHFHPDTTCIERVHAAVARQKRISSAGCLSGASRAEPVQPFPTADAAHQTRGPLKDPRCAEPGGPAGHNERPAGRNEADVPCGAHSL
jgi:hypothetical protein